MIVTGRERLRYDVSSRTGQEPYLVDLGSLRRRGVCLGRCTCSHFSMTLFPEVRRLVRAEIAGGKKFIPSDEYRCAHILAARRKFQEEWLDRIVDQVRSQFNDYGVEEESF